MRLLEIHQLYVLETEVWIGEDNLNSRIRKEMMDKSVFFLGL